MLYPFKILKAERCEKWDPLLVLLIFPIFAQMGRAIWPAFPTKALERQLQGRRKCPCPKWRLLANLKFGLGMLEDWHAGLLLVQLVVGPKGICMKYLHFHISNIRRNSQKSSKITKNLWFVFFSWFQVVHEAYPRVCFTNIAIQQSSIEK